jgi:indole-3-glycerol phosphate synthase
MPTILDEIIQTKHREIAEAKARCPIDLLKSQLADAVTPRDFFAALATAPPIRLIAEVKKASPSKGLIREDFNPVEIAKMYEAHGAACISVLTDKDFFQGSLSHLREVRAAVRLPVLRKDFIVDPYQVYESRVAGADAVLLIAECLDSDRVKELHDLVCELGMTPLVEFHQPENLPMVVGVGAKLIGINNRDLNTFTTDINQTIQLRKVIPEDRLVVGESGINHRDQVLQLEEAGAAAMLVGESLMREANLGAAVDQLLGKE